MSKFLREATVGILEALTALYYYDSETLLLSFNSYSDTQKAIKLLQDAREIVAILRAREVDNYEKNT